MSATLVLLCSCGATGAFVTGEQAYHAGWRMSGRSAELCPFCAAKRDAQARREAVAKYGAAAVKRAERILQSVRERQEK